MIRQIITLVLFLFGMFFAGIYLAYDSIDPCRALAAEEARRSSFPTGVAEVFHRIGNRGLNRFECSRDLVRSWRDRLVS